MTAAETLHSGARSPDVLGHVHDLELGPAGEQLRVAAVLLEAEVGEDVHPHVRVQVQAHSQAHKALGFSQSEASIWSRDPLSANQGRAYGHVIWL